MPKSTKLCARVAMTRPGPEPSSVETISNARLVDVPKPSKVIEHGGLLIRRVDMCVFSVRVRHARNYLLIGAAPNQGTSVES